MSSTPLAPAAPWRTSPANGADPLVRRLQRGELRAAVTFAGQGVDVLDEIAQTCETSSSASAWVRLASDFLEALVADPVFQDSGEVRQGVHLEAWVRNPEGRPHPRWLRSSVVSQPVILVAQVARYLALASEGLADAVAAGGVPVVAGHSQGVLPALLVAEAPGGQVAPTRALEVLRYAAWQGLHMARSWRQVRPAAPAGDDTSPMAAVSGLDPAVLEAELAAFHEGLPPEDRLVRALENGHTRVVLSGLPASLERFRRRLEEGERVASEARKQGRPQGRPVASGWEYLPVEAAYHSPAMAAGYEAMRATVARLGVRMRGEDLLRDLRSPVDGRSLRDHPDLAQALVQAQFLEPVAWPRVVDALVAAHGVDCVLDLGPGDGVARLTRALLRGTGVPVLPLALPEGRAACLAPGAPPPDGGPSWQTWSPRPAVAPALAVDNAFTRATGLPPVVLGGMTPTTAEVPLVAAAANAGFWAELAGGGQVTERVFHLRLEELAEALEPGREVVFNALYLDPYLWDLHLGKRRLVQRARRAGLPLRGVTVTAGVPPLDAAVRLLEELADLGMDRNGFKPGTRPQVEQVLRIARAVPDQVVFLHLEGGRAGGHHSWEELDDLLVETYGAIREHPNVVLCAGGGVGTPERAAALLAGTWAAALGRRPMPVDAVFLGTLAMACREAATSPAVKAALVAAPGHAGPVHRGAVAGGVTSGLSGLGADVHYLENAAARCGRLLDEVAGDAAAVARRRDEIVAALDATARPWFGDLAAMTWPQVLARMVTLMATGRGGRYEDGPWPDRSWRERVAEALGRAEARLAGPGPFQPLLQDLASLDRPHEVLARFGARWPAAATTPLHPADVAWFVEDLCRRPGRPVPFVPALDEDVRRWFKADSLSWCHDPRFSADQVLVLPGPEALAGLREVDEPVGDLLGRFARAMAAAADGVPRAPVREVEVPVPAGVVCESGPGHVTLVARQTADAGGWFAYLGRRFGGPLAALLATPRVQVGGRAEPNPLHRLLATREGSVLRLRLDSAGDPVAATGRPSSAAAEEVRLRLETGTSGTRAHLEVHALPGQLPLEWTFHQHGATGAWCLDPSARDAAYAAFFQAVVGSGDPVEPGATARDPVSVVPEVVASWAALTGHPPGVVPLDCCFSLVWPSLLRVLAHRSLAGGLLDLVHVDHGVEAAEGWPLRPGEALEAEARLVAREEGDEGCTLTTSARLWRGKACCVELRATFLVRRPRAGGRARQAADHLAVALPPLDGPTCAFLADHDWIRLSRPLEPGRGVRLEADWTEYRVPGQAPRFTARGTLRQGDERVGEVALDQASEAAEHPLHALVATLAPEDRSQARPRRVLAREVLHTPPSMEGFARVGGDRNPIHRSALVARLAGLPGPIVHGMWTAARVHGSLVEHLAGGRPERIRSAHATFLAPVLPDTPLELAAVRTGLADGHLEVEATASTPQGGPALRLRARVAPPRTAWVFPGQGIQRQGMGQEGYTRSRAARAVWDRADGVTRSRLGFSILQIVRENPRELVVAGERQAHPHGVLHLTWFTQVAMAVLAAAQVAELREGGAGSGDGITCGHSVGEYNALASGAGVLPLETVVELVYQRGRAIGRLVPRDARGESGFRMGVVRPREAGLDEAGAEALVREVAESTGGFLQVVNFNVRDRQYAVAGERPALAALAGALQARARPGGKPPWVEVPGIDVPFHSRALAAGVPAFRAVLEAHLPDPLDWRALVGRYIPNLVPRPFSLEDDFVSEVARVTGSAALATALAGARPRDGALARLLLVELLAWQFASPVRWIETQECLLLPPARGGLGVERVVEVGVGYQPTVANMFRQTAADLGHPVVILNAEADLDVVLARDGDLDGPPATAAPATGTAAAGASPPAPEPPPADGGAPPVPEPPIAGATPEPAAAHLEVGVQEALVALLALQARVRPEQVRPEETLDELFEGVSSRRNQVILDLGQEFGVAGLDGVHERPLADLGPALARRAAAWRFPGAYLRVHLEEVQRRVLARAGLGRADVASRLAEAWGLEAAAAPAVLLDLALESREGSSARGGPLGTLAGEVPPDRSAAHALLDRAARHAAARRGLTLRPRPEGSQAAAADPAALRALEERLLGPRGVLAETARSLARALGPEAPPPPPPAAEAPLAPDQAERVALAAPRFDPRRHVALVSGWATARRDVLALLWDGLNGRLSAADRAAAAGRLAAFAGDPALRDLAADAAARARAAGAEALAEALDDVAAGRNPAPPPVRPARVALRVEADGQRRPVEVHDDAPDALARFVEDLWAGPEPAVRAGPDGAWDLPWREVLRRAARAPLPVAGRTALVTGASPGSIAWEIARHLLRGGARVVLTASRLDRARVAACRQLHDGEAGPGAELHLVPFHQGSFTDVDALLAWLAAPGAGREPLLPDLLVPFAAVRDLGDLPEQGNRAEAALRVQLLGLERLVAGLATGLLAAGHRRCHVLLPLSPNHGGFGGDGAYAESKAALEVLPARWRSEHGAWGRALTLCAARIGWVRGTGLMGANDVLAPHLEARTGLRTFSAPEMGFLLAALCVDAAREAAVDVPLAVDLTGGFGRIPDLRREVEEIRATLAAEERDVRRRAELVRREAARLALPEPPPAVEGLPSWDPAAPVTPAPMPPPAGATLDDTVVIVGFGELGPCGTSRTRFALEVDEALSPAAVLELAWLTGLVRWSAAGWVDVATGEVVPEPRLAERYGAEVRARSGIRFVEPASAGFDPERLPLLAEVVLERDFTFTVASAEEAESFRRADPEHTRARPTEDGVEVTRTAGSTVRVPRQVRLDRRVAGQLPRGLDLGRLGVPPDLLDGVDRVALLNLVATADAFRSAGLTPEELLAWVHPTRIANTQGSGIGGMQSLRRLYVAPLLGEESPPDVLQETLVNVAAAYVVQAWTGSYGPMHHPAGACATAVLSLEEGLERIRSGRADFVVAGAFDDLGSEGAVGFARMQATADTDAMLAMGLEPDQVSRANDLRRRGFVEAQGGGTLLLARARLALELGLPVEGVLAWTGTASDGIHRSVPAPGMGVLSAAMGGAASPLARALARHGLTPDDVAVVSKHDTSTQANDVNENAVHHRIQEALGRRPGNPLAVISQKALTGHAKGGAAAWQVAGLCQVLRSGLVPGNRNLECVDPEMRPWSHLLFTDRVLRPGPAVPLRAGLLTSLGFGHVGGLGLVLHPDAFLALVPEADRDGWRERAGARQEAARRDRLQVLMGAEPLFRRRTHRRFVAPDGTPEQAAEEARLLLDPRVRLDPATGCYHLPPEVGS